MFKYGMIAALTFLSASSAGSEPATLIKQYDGVSGAVFARSVHDPPILVVFSPIVKAETILGDRKHDDPHRIIRFPSPSDLPEGVGEDLSRIAKIKLAGILLRGGPFPGSGICREFRAFTIVGKEAEQISAGLTSAFVDYSNAVAVDRPLPDVLPPCDALVQVRRGDRDEFLACVPELWPGELSPGRRALIPLFIRLTSTESEKWGKDDSFLLYETISGNPFALRVAESTTVIAMERMDPEEIAVITSSGECVRFNHIANSWGPIHRLTRELLLDVARAGTSYALFWQTPDGVLVSGVTPDLRQLGKIRNESLSLRRKESIAIASDGEALWVVAVEKIGRDNQAVLVSTRPTQDSDWSAWQQLARFPRDSKLTVDVEVVRQEPNGILYLAITDGASKKAWLYCWKN